MRYGESALLAVGGFQSRPGALQPGSPLAASGGEGEYFPVSDQESYSAIALDAPKSGTAFTLLDFKKHHALESPVTRFGNAVAVDLARPRIGNPKADCLFDALWALEMLYQCFWQNAVHPFTGHLLTDREARHDPDRELLELPEASGLLGLIQSEPESHRINGPGGTKYAARFRGRQWLLEDEFPRHLLGCLSMAGQIVCLAAVARDRAQELCRVAEGGVSIDALRWLAYKTSPALEWSQLDIRNLESVRGELWAFGGSAAHWPPLTGAVEMKLDRALTESPRTGETLCRAAGVKYNAQAKQILADWVKCHRCENRRGRGGGYFRASSSKS